MKIGNTEIILVSKELKKEEIKNNLKQFYDMCNKVFMNDNVFYSSDELKILKNDKRNKFL